MLKLIFKYMAAVISSLFIIVMSYNLYATTPVKTVQIVAKRFSYQPEKLILKKDVPVILELISLDRLHGFNIPALGIRADVIPGQTTQVTITPTKTGKFVFMCDIFCGSDHTEMHGQIIITE